MKTHSENRFHQNGIVELIRPSPIYAFASVIPILIVSLIALPAAVIIYSPLICAAVLLGIVALYRYLCIIKIRYVLTKETIIMKTGILARKYDNLELFRVKDLIVSQSIFERIFGLMTIRIHTTDLSTNILNLKGIPLSNISETIRELVQTARLKNHIIGVD